MIATKAEKEEVIQEKLTLSKPREVLSKKGMVNTSKLGLAITRTWVTLWNRFLEVGWGIR